MSELIQPFIKSAISGIIQGNKDLLHGHITFLSLMT